MRYELERMVGGGAGPEPAEELAPEERDFLRALNALLSNELPPASLLSGLPPVEHAAFMRVFSLIEDSGWSLEDVDGERARADAPPSIAAVSDHEVFQPPRNGRAAHL